MQIKEIMTSNPTCCTADTNLQEVARLMMQHHCGAIPVVENIKNMRPVGILTARDITCRAVAQVKNPFELAAADCMSTPCLTVTAETSVDDCCALMKNKRIRRVPVVDENGQCCGMVSQTDIAARTVKNYASSVL